MVDEKVLKEAELISDFDRVFFIEHYPLDIVKEMYIEMKRQHPDRDIHRMQRNGLLNSFSWHSSGNESKWESWYYQFGDGEEDSQNSNNYVRDSDDWDEY